MAQAYIPQAPDLIGMMTQIQGFKDNKKKLDLLGKEYESKQAQVQEEKKNKRVESLFNMLKVPNLPENDQQMILDEVTKTLGLPRVVGGKNMKDAVKRATGILEAYQKGADVTPALIGLIRDFPDNEKLLTNLKGKMDEIGKQQDVIKGEFLNRLLKSGGVVPGQERSLLESFAWQSGSPYLGVESEQEQSLLGASEEPGGNAFLGSAAINKLTPVKKKLTHVGFTADDVPMFTDEEGNTVVGSPNLPVAKKEPGKEKRTLGEITETDYRQYLNDARTAAMKMIKFNEPNQLAMLLAIAEKPEAAGVLGAQLEQSMTPEQVQEYESQIDLYINTYTPPAMVSEYKARISRMPQKKVRAAPGEDTDLGQVNKEIGKPAPKQPASQQKPQPQTPLKKEKLPEPADKEVRTLPPGVKQSGATKTEIEAMEQAPEGSKITGWQYDAKLKKWFVQFVAPDGKTYRYRND